MFAPLRHAVIIVLGLAGSTLAGDNVRLIGSPSDRDDVRRLDIRPGDQAQDETERTHYRYGVRFYGGFGYSRGFGYYGYRPYSYYGGFGLYGYRPYSYYGGFGLYGYRPYSYSFFGPSFGYYSPSFYSSYPTYSYSYYCPPIYYSAPPDYYSSPVVIYSSIAAATADNGEVRNGTTTYRYDGDRAIALPIERIPPAKIEPQAIPELPTPPAVPKLGPSPTELKVSGPAPSAKKKYTYPAYGEDREKPRDDKSLLIRRDK